MYSEQLSYGGPVGDYYWFTKTGMELLPGSYPFHPRGVGYPTGSGCKPISIDTPAAGATATKTIIAAELIDSNGDPLAGGQGVYLKDGYTSNIGGATDASGAACQVVDGALTDVEAWMRYRGTESAHQTQDVSVDSIFTFQTSAVTVTLSDHLGGSLDGGAAAYKAPASTGYVYWLVPNSQAVSETDGTGQVVGELFDGTYDFRMQYNQGTEWKNAVPVAGATTVAFQTGLLSIVYSEQLSFGGPVGDYAFFTKAGMELLPVGYMFHPRGVGYPANAGCKPISITAPAAGTTATKTIVVAELIDSNGDPLAGGQGVYLKDGFTSGIGGATDASGAACQVVDGALTDVEAWMRYRGTESAHQTQDVSVDSIFTFQTSAVTVTLSDHLGGPLAGGAAAYKAPASTGSTYWLVPNSQAVSETDAAGQVVGELFDGTYDFRMQYNQGTEWKNAVPVAGATTVAFQTGLLSIVYSEQLSFGGSVGDAAFFTKTGTELLPGSYMFHPRGVGYPANAGCKSTAITAPAAGTTATKTIIVAELIDSNGDPLAGGRGYYKLGGSTYFLGPETDTSGAACKVIDGAKTTVEAWMKYLGTESAHQTQDVSADSIFTFQTSAVTVTLFAGATPLANGAVAHKAPASTGSTYWLVGNNPALSKTDAAGQVVGQLFDGTYDFRMGYSGSTYWKDGVTVSGATTVPFVIS